MHNVARTRLGVAAASHQLALLNLLMIQDVALCVGSRKGRVCKGSCYSRCRGGHCQPALYSGSRAPPRKHCPVSGSLLGLLYPLWGHLQICHTAGSSEPSAQGACLLPCLTFLSVPDTAYCTTSLPCTCIFPSLCVTLCLSIGMLPAHAGSLKALFRVHTIFCPCPHYTVTGFTAASVCHTLLLQRLLLWLQHRMCCAGRCSRGVWPGAGRCTG